MGNRWLCASESHTTFVSRQIKLQQATDESEHQYCILANLCSILRCKAETSERKSRMELSCL